MSATLFQYVRDVFKKSIFNGKSDDKTPLHPDGLYFCLFNTDIVNFLFTVPAPPASVRLSPTLEHKYQLYNTDAWRMIDKIRRTSTSEMCSDLFGEQSYHIGDDTSILKRTRFRIQGFEESPVYRYPHNAGARHKPFTEELTLGEVWMALKFKLIFHVRTIPHNAPIKIPTKNGFRIEYVSYNNGTWCIPLDFSIPAQASAVADAQPTPRSKKFYVLPPYEMVWDAYSLFSLLPMLNLHGNLATQKGLIQHQDLLSIFYAEKINFCNQLTLYRLNTIPHQPERIANIETVLNCIDEIQKRINYKNLKLELLFDLANTESNAEPSAKRRPIESFDITIKISSLSALAVIDLWLIEILKYYQANPILESHITILSREIEFNKAQPEAEVYQYNLYTQHLATSVFSFQETGEYDIEEKLIRNISSISAQAINSIEQTFTITHDLLQLLSNVMARDFNVRQSQSPAQASALPSATSRSMDQSQPMQVDNRPKHKKTSAAWLASIAKAAEPGADNDDDDDEEEEANSGFRPDSPYAYGFGQQQHIPGPAPDFSRPMQLDLEDDKKQAHKYIQALEEYLQKKDNLGFFIRKLANQDKTKDSGDKFYEEVIQFDGARQYPMTFHLDGLPMSTYDTPFVVHQDGFVVLATVLAQTAVVCYKQPAHTNKIKNVSEYTDSITEHSHSIISVGGRPYTDLEAFSNKIRMREQYPHQAPSIHTTSRTHLVLTALTTLASDLTKDELITPADIAYNDTDQTGEAFETLSKKCIKLTEKLGNLEAQFEAMRKNAKTYQGRYAELYDKCAMHLMLFTRSHIYHNFSTYLMDTVEINQGLLKTKDQRYPERKMNNYHIRSYSTLNNKFYRILPNECLVQLTPLKNRLKLSPKDLSAKESFGDNAELPQIAAIYLQIENYNYVFGSKTQSPLKLMNKLKYRDSDFYKMVSVFAHQLDPYHFPQRLLVPVMTYYITQHTPSKPARPVTKIFGIQREPNSQDFDRNVWNLFAFDVLQYATTAKVFLDFDINAALIYIQKTHFQISFLIFCYIIDTAKNNNIRHKLPQQMQDFESLVFTLGLDLYDESNMAKHYSVCFARDMQLGVHPVLIDCLFAKFLSPTNYSYIELFKRHIALFNPNRMADAINRGEMSWLTQDSIIRQPAHQQQMQIAINQFGENGELKKLITTFCELFECQLGGLTDMIQVTTLLNTPELLFTADIEMVQEKEAPFLAWLSRIQEALLADRDAIDPSLSTQTLDSFINKDEEAYNPDEASAPLVNQPMLISEVPDQKPKIMLAIRNLLVQNVTLIVTDRRHECERIILDSLVTQFPTVSKNILSRLIPAVINHLYQSQQTYQQTTQQRSQAMHQAAAAAAAAAPALQNPIGRSSYGKSYFGNPGHPNIPPAPAKNQQYENIYIAAKLIIYQRQDIFGWQYTIAQLKIFCADAVQKERKKNTNFPAGCFKCGRIFFESADQYAKKPSFHSHIAKGDDHQQLLTSLINLVLEHFPQSNNYEYTEGKKALNLAIKEYYAVELSAQAQQQAQSHGYLPEHALQGQYQPPASWPGFTTPPAAAPVGAAALMPAPPPAMHGYPQLPVGAAASMPAPPPAMHGYPPLPVGAAASMPAPPPAMHGYPPLPATSTVPGNQQDSQVFQNELTDFIHTLLNKIIERGSPPYQRLFSSADAQKYLQPQAVANLQPETYFCFKCGTIVENGIDGFSLHIYNEISSLWNIVYNAVIYKNEFKPYLKTIDQGTLERMINTIISNFYGQKLK